MPPRLAAAGQLIYALVCGNPHAKERELAKDPVEGGKAPAFTLDRDGGGKLSLADFAGKPLVLYFYPKDDTTACTGEAKDFSAAAPAFKRAGVGLLGVSRDTVKAHDKFVAKYDLKIPLASDPEGGTVEAYGSWVEKQLYGRKYMGIDRSTFLIDARGKIVRIWRKVRVKGHVDEVLAAAKDLVRK